jgi:hypothetical protein
MTHLLLEHVLETLPGARKDGAAFLLAEELDVTLYVSLGEEVLQISRASRVEFSGTASNGRVLSVLTHKGERFYLPPERVIGLKTGVTHKPVALGAGFRA